MDTAARVARIRSAFITEVVWPSRSRARETEPPRLGAFFKNSEEDQPVCS